MEKKSKS